MLAGGTRLVVDMEEWINKTSGRGSITLGVDNEDCEDPDAASELGRLSGTFQLRRSSARGCSRGRT